MNISFDYIPLHAETLKLVMMKIENNRKTYRVLSCMEDT